MLAGRAIARDFIVNDLGRVRLVGGTDALYQILYKFFETAFRQFAFKKVDLQYTPTVQAGVKTLTENFVQSQRFSVNFSLFKGSEIVKEIAVNSVVQTAADEFTINLTVALASGTRIDIPSIVRFV